MTPTEANAVKALVDPRSMTPRTIWTMVTRVKAKTGRSEIERVQTLANGSALSRLKGHVDWEAAVVMLTEQKRVTRRTATMRASAPAFEPMIKLTMNGRACP